MSVDLNFWKCQSGSCPDNETVYQKACCDREKIDGLEILPTDAILKETAAAFRGWTSSDLFHYESREHGSFQISTTPQTVRFDCYSMSRADMKRFSAVLAKFGCPLYDPQQGVRFDKIYAFLTDEAGEYKTQVEQNFSRLLPRLEMVTQVVTWDEYVSLSKTLKQLQYNAVIHRAKTITKVTSFLQFGNAWANRPCQCKTAQLTDREQARQLLEGLLQRSIERVVNDFLEKTYYE